MSAPSLPRLALCIQSCEVTIYKYLQFCLVCQSSLGMADPFGIINIALTGLKVAKHLHDLILDLSNAPAELLALSNEVCNLKFVLDAIRDAVQDAEKRHESLQEFDRFGPLLFQ